MDSHKLAEIFKATIDVNQRENAEKQLDQIHKIIGFTPSILQLVMSTSIEMPVRQAAVVYLKNSVVAYWADKEASAPQMEFSIHEQDRGLIRESIIDACVHSPELIAVHLAVCINHIIRHDFPNKWTGIIDKVLVYLQMPDNNLLFGALMAIYQLVKNYEYKTHNDRLPLDDSMNLLLPIIYQRLTNLMQDSSDTSVLLQKQILKIFYAFVQYSFPLKLLNKQIFTEWMEVFRMIMERPVPESVNQLESEERPENCHWKCKKWAIHILTRVFERYGSPGTVHKDYKEFSDWYTKTFSVGIINVLLKVLEQHGNDVYVAPRVLQQTLNYFNTAVNHSFTWKLIKTHMVLMIQNIIFPLMCYTDEDDELWTLDPHEYIRSKFDVFEDYVSPVTAAQTLLYTCCKKRKDMLQKTSEFVMQILTESNSSPRMIDGALHMIGSVAELLLKKNMFKDHIENILVAYVFPHFQSQFGYLRARSCWVLHYFAHTRFQNDANLYQALNNCQHCLLSDEDLPVKVEAAICLQALVSAQEKIQKMVEGSVTQIAMELLTIIRDTENEDLTNVMQKLVCLYPEHLTGIAVEMTQHLAQTFKQMIENSDEDENEDKALTAMGLLNTIDTILTMMEDQIEIMKQLEPIVVQIVEDIFKNEQMDLYEEAMTLVCTVSTNYVSPELWKIFELMYHVFTKDGFDYFTDMMPALHNFVTVDPEAFLSNSNHVLAIYEMCKTVMNSEAGEDAECHAAKLMECMILQFKGQIDQCIHPFVELVLSRLTREVKTAELKTICLQVVIAAFYYNPELLIETLEKMQPANSNQSLFTHFVKQWMNDSHLFLGLHDRKICVLGLLTLISLPPAKRSGVINEMAAQIVPTALHLFEGLKLAYQAKANADNQSSSDSEEGQESDDNEIEALEDDEDHIAGSENLQQIVKKMNASFPFPVTSASIEDIEEDASDEETDTDGEDEDEFEQTALESYTTLIDDEDASIDEYVAFKEVLESLQANDANWYNALISPLSSQQQKGMQNVFMLAVQRKAAAESRKIEKSGGYVFTQQQVPMSFNFGGSPIG
ncbi:Importin-7-like protein [Leptotrombidium deliense]|uniref:Importin-7-like protein n=1 Tax=Leptotrombidium deliense TaxID=299467 RepID=A0A443SUQ1_9ACAR|nr:Importin-7-like protein [Leptotrombidium deliense]